MIPEQKRLAQAYAEIFGGVSGQMVLDDLAGKANGFVETSERGGALNLLLHIMVQRSALRRAAQRGPLRPAKRTV
jgi:hypothetical protein